MSAIGFVDRLGGMLVAPRATLARVGAGEGGLSDVLWLLAARVLAGNVEVIARALVGAPVTGWLAAVPGVLHAASFVLPDLLGMLLGAAVLALVGRHRFRGRELDVAAYCWIPFLAAQIAGELLFTALQRPASPVEQRVLDAASLGWAAIAFGLALLASRTPAAAESAAAEGEGSGDGGRP